MLRVQWWGALVVALALVQSWAALAAAQERSLSWDSMVVQAQLDQEGRLHVIETQVMRLNGAWNGGERTFRVGPGQSLQLLSLHEIAADGLRRPYVEGTLASVGEYAFVEGQTLRWRARAADDPPFRDELRTFELRYVLSGILVPAGSHVVLDHDFAFADRDGAIRRFSAALTLDPAWQALQPLPETIEASELAPGASVIRRFELRYVRGGPPPGVISSVEALELPAPRSVSAAIFAVLLLMAAAMFLSFARRERASGHRAPLPGALIDRAWLDQHVFCHPAEVIGAAWDRHVGTPEVASLLARLTAEGKLHSQVIPSAGQKGDPVLQLELRCKREAFSGYERQLVDGLFFDGDTTDTSRIRSHYAGSGFDPAGLIRSGLETEVAGRFGMQRPLASWRGKLTLGAALLSSIAIGRSITPQTLSWAPACLVLTFSCWGVARFQAAKYRDTVTELRPRACKTAISAGLLWIWLALVYLVLDSRLTTFQLGMIALLALTSFWSVCNGLEPRELAVSYRLRRCIAVVREFFARELASPTPRIEHDWLPYLIAFDLGPDMDAWFRAFAGTQRTRSSWQDDASTTSAAQGWAGGGGAFGGAGASGTWVAAASVIASGVAAPSSSSSSSSGSSSSSSGGGGGGGW